MPTKNLLLLHGALGSKEQLAQLKGLLTNQFIVHSLDFEGHGDRPSDQVFSIELFTENVKDFILKNGLEQTNIFGYSMGGYVALNLAIKYPELADRILTLGTKFNWTKESAEQEVKMLNPDIIEQKVPKFAGHLKNLHGLENWKTVLHKTAGMMLELGNGAALHADSFERINQHVLIGIGTLDNMVSIEESKNIAAHLKNGQLKIIEGFKHPIEKNDPLQLAKIINDFING